MTSLVLSLVVMTSSGGLLSERTPAVGMLVGAVDLAAAAASLDGMSLSELTAERARLVDSMPSLGAGIALTAVGAGVLVVGLALVSTFYTALIVAGLVMMAVSVPLLIIGPILIAGAARGRRDTTARVRLIDQRLGEMQRNVAPLQNEMPPPPPPRPPGVERSPAVEPQLLLATF